MSEVASLESKVVNAINELSFQERETFSKWCFNEKQGLNLIGCFNGIESDNVDPYGSFEPFINRIINLTLDCEAPKFSIALKSTKNGLTALNVIYGIPNN